jgi:mono/diheme cytochrome c family protein
MKWTINTAMQRRKQRATAFAVVLGAALLTGCDLRDMYDQPKYTPLQKSEFFDDHRSARPSVPDTVARGQLRTNTVFYAGTADGKLVDAIPIPITESLLRRGQQRYDIFCAPCHDRIGNGNGMIVQRGFRAPPSLHVQRLRTAPAGHFFDVMTRGFGAMPDFAAQITPQDRWAIVAYIRALQLSQNATVADVPAEERSKLEQTAQ